MPILIIHGGPLTILSQKVCGITPNAPGFKHIRICPQMGYLKQAACTVESVSALTDLPSLETLHLEHSAVRDLTSLGAMRALRTVTVSADMLPLRWSDSAAFDVVLVP